MKILQTSVSGKYKKTKIKFYLICSLAILLFISIIKPCFGTENEYKATNNHISLLNTQTLAYDNNGSIINTSPALNGFNELNNLFFANSNHGSTLLPDSMLGVESDGYDGYIKKPYKEYYYTVPEKPDTAYNSSNCMYRFNSIKHRVYDEKGRLVSFFVQQLRIVNDLNDNQIGSNVIMIYNEQNKYKDDRLINKNIKYLHGFHYVTENFNYEYDSLGRLVNKIYEEIEYNRSEIKEYKYIYNLDNSLKYIIEKGKGLKYFIQYFEYNINDSLINTNHYFSCLSDTNNLDSISLDSISNFSEIHEFTEIFDNLKQKTCEKVRIWEKPNGGSNLEVVENYILMFTYNERNDIKTIAYSELIDTLELIYKEFFRESFSYTDMGNILYHEKTFFDERTNAWEIYESQTYFYPGYTTGIESKSIQTKSNDLIVYPNPVYDKLSLKGDFNPTTNYSIVNLVGKTLNKGTLAEGEIDVSWLELGIYIIIVETNSGLQFGKFVKY